MADVRLGPGWLDRINVLNDPVNSIDPFGLEEWQFHGGHHGGDHFQKGNVRYDAKTLKPIPHKGKIPPGLSKSAIKNLQKSNAWAKYLKFGGKIGGGALAILLELALPADAHAPDVVPPQLPPPLLLIPLELIPPPDLELSEPCQ